MQEEFIFNYVFMVYISQKKKRKDIHTEQLSFGDQCVHFLSESSLHTLLDSGSCLII